MNEHCKYCTQPRKPRKDRPGKFFTMCEEHYAEYMRGKAREHYHRNEEKMRKRAQDYRIANPEKVAASVREYNNRPEVQERKRQYMRTYLRPWREHVQDSCEQCGYVSQEEDRRDLDVHHIDENRQNNDPSNLITLCPTCHRQIRHVPGRTKAQA